MDDLVWGIRNNGENAIEASGQPTIVHEAPLTVEVTNNHVYFYAGVDSDRCLDLIKKIRELDTTLRNERLSRDLPPDYPDTPIWLHINSPGGGLFTAFSIADQLQKINSPIFTIVEGYAASAATLISMSGTRRYITPSSFMLIHQLSNFFWGKYEEFKDEMHLMEMAMGRLTGFYTSRSHLTTERVKELLGRDSWFDATECVEMGLADEILT